MGVLVVWLGGCFGWLNVFVGWLGVCFVGWLDVLLGWVFRLVGCFG